MDTVLVSVCSCSSGLSAAEMVAVYTAVPAVVQAAAVISEVTVASTVFAEPSEPV